MTVLLQLSDPHFGTERPVAIHALRELCRELRPNVVVLSGDITQRARRAQFRRARNFVDSLGADAVLAIPGNHDIPLFDLVTRALAPYREQRRAFGQDLEPVLDLADMLVLGVNTTRAYRHKNGEVSANQVERIGVRLSRARAEQLRMLVVHQPIAASRPADEHNVLRGARAAMRRWAAAGADLIIGGHIHLPYVLPLHEKHALPRRVWAVQAGTAVSSRVRHEAGNSVNVIVYAANAQDPRRARVERWDLDETTERFAIAQTHELTLEP